MHKSKVLLLITALSILIVCALPLYIQFIIWPSYDQFVIHTTENGLRALAVEVVKDQRLQTPLSKEAPTPPFLIDEVERIRKIMGLLKVKIFTPQGLIVYSSAQDDIGNFSRQKFFQQMLIDGLPRSELIQRSVVHDDGKEWTHDIIETYVPIIHNGQALGAFEIYYDVTAINKSLHLLMRNQLRVLVPAALILLIVTLASTYYANKSMQDLAAAKDRFQELAVTDTLTGLLNPRGFRTNVERQLKIIDRGDKYSFLIFIDLNDFKAINDSLGHDIGDQALAEAAGILKHTFRNADSCDSQGSDIIGRVGGDEFAILTTQNSALDDELVISRRLEEHISQWNSNHHAAGYTISMSYGIVAYSPQQPCTFKELMQKADALMYENKQRRKKDACSS